MIELLGIGVRRAPDGWILRSASATFDGGQLIVVNGAAVEDRLALLDVVAARRIPVEGRAWIDRVPLMPGTVSRLRTAVADVDPAAAVAERRSLLWNVVPMPARLRPLGRLLRLPRRRDREAAATALSAVGLADRQNTPAFVLSRVDRVRLLVAQALARRPRHLVVRDLDTALPPHDTPVILALLRSLTRSERRVIVVGLAEPSLATRLADRVCTVADATIRLDGPPGWQDIPAERHLQLIRP